MEQSNAMEYGSRKASPNVLKPRNCLHAIQPSMHLYMNNSSRTKTVYLKLRLSASACNINNHHQTAQQFKTQYTNFILNIYTNVHPDNGFYENRKPVGLIVIN
jgi:hypothetical protein